MLSAIAFALCSVLGLHPGPPVFVQVEVTEQSIDVKLSGEQATVLPWLPRARDLSIPVSAPLAPDVEADLIEEAQALSGELLRLTVEGEVLAARVVSVKVFPDFGPGNPEPSIELNLTYAVQSKPRQVGVTWLDFERLAGKGRPKLPVMVEADDAFEFATLIAEEPELLWHASVAREKKPRPVSNIAPLVRTSRWPLFSMILIGAAIVLIPLVRTQSKHHALARSMASVLVLCALLGWNWKSEAPFGIGQSALSDAERELIFERLHRNIYAAFEAQSEDQIYDVLSRSVEEELLDQIYGDIYESLILRDNGGAVSEVEEVEVLDRTVIAGVEQATAFEVEWCWVVKGVVTHWGHQHRRANRYRARYAVGVAEGAWKIRGVELLDQELLPTKEDEDV